jgi:hypothetical protein
MGRKILRRLVSGGREAGPDLFARAIVIVLMLYFILASRDSRVTSAAAGALAALMGIAANRVFERRARPRGNPAGAVQANPRRAGCPDGDGRCVAVSTARPRITTGGAGSLSSRFQAILPRHAEDHSRRASRAMARRIKPPCRTRARARRALRVATRRAA